MALKKVMTHYFSQSFFLTNLKKNHIFFKDTGDGRGETLTLFGPETFFDDFLFIFIVGW